MLISQSNLQPASMKGEVAIVTGGGRGIGYEAARALLWLGADVVIAEINEENGKAAAENLQREFGKDRAIFVKTDVGSDGDVEKLISEISEKRGKIDIVLNNATVFPIGAVKDLSVDKWDFSYGVNLRGPVLLGCRLLPDMIQRKHGVFVCVSSSGTAPFMGAYEVFKTAQVELANTIAAEVEGTGVYCFTIGPGIVQTPGFLEGGSQVAFLMGKTIGELLDMNRNFEISAEAAGVGFAASIALAPKYHGKETSSIQVLREIGIVLGEKIEPATANPVSIPHPQLTGGYKDLFNRVLQTYSNQSEGWKKRNVFERSWVARDFKKNTGMSIDEMQTALDVVRKQLDSRTLLPESVETLKKLRAYYGHQEEQLKGFEKDPHKLKENLAIIDGWVSDLKELVELWTQSGASYLKTK